MTALNRTNVELKRQRPRLIIDSHAFLESNQCGIETAYAVVILTGHNPALNRTNVELKRGSGVAK